MRDLSPAMEDAGYRISIAGITILNRLVSKETRIFVLFKWFVPNGLQLEVLIHGPIHETPPPDTLNTLSTLPIAAKL